MAEIVDPGVMNELAALRKEIDDLKATGGVEEKAIGIVDSLLKRINRNTLIGAVLAYELFTGKLDVAHSLLRLVTGG